MRTISWVIILMAKVHVITAIMIPDGDHYAFARKVVTLNLEI